MLTKEDAMTSLRVPAFACVGRTRLYFALAFFMASGYFTCMLLKKS
jgi:hypothetical protein